MLWTNSMIKAIEKYGHISTWQTGEVTDMSHLFEVKKEFNEDISSWDVSKVTNMEYMFNMEYLYINKPSLIQVIILIFI